MKTRSQAAAQNKGELETEAVKSPSKEEITMKVRTTKQDIIVPPHELEELRDRENKKKENGKKPSRSPQKEETTYSMEVEDDEAEDEYFEMEDAEEGIQEEAVKKDDAPQQLRGRNDKDKKAEQGATRSRSNDRRYHSRSQSRSKR